MGWCSATQIFDSLAEKVLADDAPIAEDFAEELLDDMWATLQCMDWDCESDSEFFEHPVVQRIAKARHPEWFMDDV